MGASTEKIRLGTSEEGAQGSRRWSRWARQDDTGSGCSSLLPSSTQQMSTAQHLVVSALNARTGL